MEEQKLLLGVLRANDDGKLYDSLLQLTEVADRNPPLVFEWVNVERFVDAVRLARDESGECPPFDLSKPLTEQHFKEALLDYIGASNEEPAMGTSVLPCSLKEALLCVEKLADLRAHPWIHELLRHGGRDVLPLARIYVAQPQTQVLKRVLEAKPHWLPVLWG